MATNTSGLSPSHLFFVTDRTSGLRLLVDTGAEVSVLPVARLSRSSLPAGPPFQAVNNSSIATFGTTSRTLNLGLRRTTLIYHNLMSKIMALQNWKLLQLFGVSSISANTFMGTGAMSSLTMKPSKLC